MMNFTSPFFITMASSGVCFLIFGWVFLKYPPRTINGTYGYRSRRSKSSQEAWDFSQPMAARLMLKSGFAMTLTAFAGCFISFGQIADVVVALAALILSCVVLGIRMERELARRFSSSSNQ